MTKISNPNYTPEIFASAVIINYSVTPDGLKEQLLNRIVDFENAELERRRKENVEIMSRNKREKKELEDELLKELSKEGDLLQNTELVRKLEESKTKSTLINQILREGKESKEKIDKERMSYELGAIRGQVL
jgi:dynein heavy chain